MHGYHRCYTWVKISDLLFFKIPSCPPVGRTDNIAHWSCLIVKSYNCIRENAMKFYHVASWDGKSVVMRNRLFLFMVFYVMFHATQFTAPNKTNLAEATFPPTQRWNGKYIWRTSVLFPLVGQVT